jgi:transposase
VSYTVGLDWGSKQHLVCVLNETGGVKKRFTVEHSREGLERLLRELRKIAPPQELPVAIERPSGVLVDTLLEAEHPVIPIHPNVVKASRSRYRANSSKSDPHDAYLLADLLRTDAHRFTPLSPLSDEMRAIRTLARARDEMVRQRVMLSNQLLAVLERAWPGGAAIFADLASPIALAFLERYPTSSSARTLGEKRLAAFLVKHHYSGRKSASELLARLKSAPHSTIGEHEEEATREIVLSLVCALNAVVGRLNPLTRALEHASASTAMGRLVMSFPRTGRLNAAQIVAELGDDPNRFTSRDHLASEAGVAPVTHASGKSRGVTSRYACNKRLKRALTTWANNSRHADPWAARIYQHARARGCRHPHATRILAKAWTRILHACWRNGTPYDPTITNHQPTMG